MWKEIAVAARLAKGYRLRPWQSPYLKWRIETWSGVHADSVTRGIFLNFVWNHRKDLWRYLQWAAKQSDPGLETRR